MTIVVPFDGSALSKAALRRAQELTRSPEELRVLAVIPKNNRRYAIERGWIDESDAFDTEQVLSKLSEAVSELTPEATFEYVTVGRYANAGQVANKIRNYAREHNARVVVIGSDNAGRIVTSVTSVGSTVAASTAYDVYIVRHPDVTTTDSPEDHSQVKKDRA